MKILLSDGSGLTSRQVATRLGAAGHVVEVLNPQGFALTRFTRWVRAVHTCPRFGAEPFAWLDAAVRVLEDGDFDALIATQEQVIILAREAERIHRLGVAMAVPAFNALMQVQDKIRARATLARIGLPQPPSVVAATAGDLLCSGIMPAFVKTAVGTAGTGVRHVTDHRSLELVAREMEARGAFLDGGVLVQRPAPGPLVMVQAVFAEGELVAWHANLRVREGSGGGACNKRSIHLPAVGEHLTRLGAGLGWHGALSMDAILGPEGPSYIDVNPRLVEPGNALRSGVDLVGALLDISLGHRPGVSPPSVPDVATHQLILAVMGAATHGRAAVARELFDAVTKRGTYRSSAEELTPLRRDLQSVFPVALISMAMLTMPGLTQKLTKGAVASYAIGDDGWRRIHGTFLPHKGENDECSGSHDQVNACGCRGLGPYWHKHDAGERT